MATVASHGNYPTLGSTEAVDRIRTGPPRWLQPVVEQFCRIAKRHPVASLLGLMIVSNIAGTVFNVFYNFYVIGTHTMDRDQRLVFELSIPVYNAVAWPVCVGAMIYLSWPLGRCLRQLRRGAVVAPASLERCRRRLINLPRYARRVNALGWLPGALYFPLVVCLFGGSNKWMDLWWQFPISFLISALITIAQTFFITESFLIAFLYPELFRDARPEDIRGAVRISYRERLILLWLAVACMPLAALFVALRDTESLLLASVLFVAVTVTSLGIFGIVGRDLLVWVQNHAAAVTEIGRGNFDVRIEEQRPDEWGRLTNHFNDMAAALGRARQLRETFGQFVNPDVRDEIIARMPGLDVTVQEITVMFADIRGFTRRTAGEPPERVGHLLNRFLTLALRAVEEKGGLVNKFLGDGFMALFGATRPRDDHADLALASAQDLLQRLQALNEELERQGQERLKVGVGIHTGPALVGCFGATLDTNGRVQMRREFTAIGETVNFCQRLEQLTKTCGGPILLSDDTRSHLRDAAGLACLECLGPQELAGAPAPLVVHRAGET